MGQGTEAGVGSISWAIWIGVLGVLVGLASAGCDKAKEPYASCLKEEAENHIDQAIDQCQGATNADPDSASGKAAATKLAELQRKKKDETEKAAAAASAKAKQDEAARQAAAEAMKARWPTMPSTLAKKIRSQAMSDLTHGGATSVLDVIASEIGRPDGSYDAGMSFFYIWGAQLGGSPTKDEMKGAPFAVRMMQGLTCGDYPTGTEFYSYGKRVQPD